MSTLRPGGGRSLTRLGAWFLVAALTLIALGLLREGVWLYLMALLAIGSVVASWFAAPRLRDIDLSVRRPTLEPAGGPTRYGLTFRSARAVPPHRVVVHPEGADPVTVAHLGSAAGQAVSCDIEVHGTRRGVFRQMRMTASATSPFGLVRMERVVDIALDRVVVPVPEDVAVAPGTTADDGTSGQARISRSGDDLHGIRAWQPGDGSSVHWRSTLRRGIPMVVERETTLGRSLVVLVAAHPDSLGFERLLAQVAGIVSAAARDRARVSVLVEGRTWQTGDGTSDSLLRWLASLPDDLRIPSGATVEQAVRAAGQGGKLLVARNSPLPASWADHLTQTAAAAGVDLADLLTTDPGPGPRPPAAPVPPLPGQLLRTAAAASVLTGVLAMALVGLTSAGVASLSAASLLAAVGVARGLDRWQRVRPARRAASWGVVALTLLVAGSQWSSGSQLPALATALSLLAVAQVLAQDTRRDALVSLWLGPIMVVTAAGLEPGPALALPMVAAWVAVLVGTAAASEDSILDDVDARTGPPSPVPAVRGLVPLATSVVASALIAFLLLPLGSAPTLGRSLLALNPAVPSSEEMAASQPPDFQGALDLRARGRLPDYPVVSVREGGPALWRAMSLDTSEGGTWSATRYVQGSLAVGSDGSVQLPVDATESGDADVPQRAYEVRPSEYSGLTLLAPGAPSSVTGPSVVFQQLPDSFFLGTDVPEPYVVTAAPRDDMDSLAPGSGSTGADRTDLVWLTLDSGTTPRTVELARQITAGLTDRVAQVQAIETWLRANVRYTLEAASPAPGQDPVDFLLFESFEGFCQHYAAAEAIMLRSLGVPSRVATGFAFPSEGEDGWVTATAADAHAWVEVWIPGKGWVSSDPTAGAQLADSASKPWNERLAAAFSSMWSSDASRRVLAVGVALVALLVLVLVGVRRRRPGRSSSDGPVVGRRHPEPLAAFARLRTALGHDGHGLLPGDGVAEVRRRAAAHPEVLGALDVVERSLYDLAPVTPAERLGAADTLDRWTATLLAADATTTPDGPRSTLVRG